MSISRLLRGRIVILCAALAMMSIACSPARNPVPVELIDQAEVAGFSNIRTWGGHHSEIFLADLIESVHQARQAAPNGYLDETGAVSMLSISGGGPDGAFGTGLIYGWSQTGTRPVFKLVTGISTGALIAPLAFLGEDYDEQLKAVYTTVSTKDIYTERSPLIALMGSDALMDTAPLARLIKKHINDEVIDAVAVAHEQGRRLYIGTTNLDARRLEVWNMGAIAVHRTAEARDLFRQVMLASASIPVAFPPQRIIVEAGDKTYDEIHVDGGVQTQAFLYGVMFKLDDVMKEVVLDEEPTIRLYVIRNSRFRAAYKNTKAKVLSLAGRAVGGMIGSMGVGDMYRMYTLATADGLDFNMTSIPDDYESEAEEAFDPNEMARLFEIGRRLITEGDPWQKVPPGMEERQE
ncbi:MAG: patatin-like phospholipase family protein [Planctomycetota bacterium]|jgi:hypothetical protein